MEYISVTLAFFGFDSVGFAELLVIGAVVLIVVGPHRLPGALRKMGEVVSHLKRAANEFKQELMTMDEPPPRHNDDNVIDVDSSESSYEDSSSDYSADGNQDDDSGDGNQDEDSGLDYTCDDSGPQMPDDMESAYPGQTPYEEDGDSSPSEENSDSGNGETGSAEEESSDSGDDPSKKESVS